MEIKEDLDFLYREAIDQALKSKLQPKIGSIIYYGNNRILSKGINKITGGRPISFDQIRGDEKFINHAEVEALRDFKFVNAYNHFVYTIDSNIKLKMIVAGKCICLNCAKEIVNGKIQEVHCPPPDTKSKWVDSNKEALQYLKDNNVTVILSDKLKGVEEGLTCESKYV